MPQHQWDYLFAIGTIFAGIGSYMIGANDVANSFATSVSSKSLTLRQACLAAAVMEFLGAVLVGARVTTTIKNGIVGAEIFADNPGVQLLGFTVAIVSSSIWLTIATRMAWPVSTTYSVVSAITGIGIAAGGWDAPRWGWHGAKGLAAIFSGLIIAPAIGAAFGIAIYLLVKYGVLLRKDSVRWGMITAPIVFFLVGAVLTMSIIYKGSPSLGLDDLPSSTQAIAICVTAAVVSIISILFWLPYVYTKIVKKDYTLKWYHFFFGPFLLRRQPPEDAGEMSAVPDYRIRAENDLDAPTAPAAAETDSEKVKSESEKVKESGDSSTDGDVHPSKLADEIEKPVVEGLWIKPKNLWILFRYHALPWLTKLLLHGSSVDIHEMQKDKHTLEAHSRAKQYPNETEHLYSFMQVMTACVASFGHGANDVSNSIGPFAVIYHVWATGQLSGDDTPVPIWSLVFGGAMLVIGLATYGYNVMKVLGNRITLMSPSRGFSMELAASITVILASQYGIPVSSTMCITGATVGVSLCNGDWRATNWRAIAWIYAGWILTVPIVATISACMMGIIINAPRF
ncbi:sodium:inorganic phosphate symporter [Coprinopsis cinerea AmutBmut pab1-1]|nr:sodium:inorganic phosphate symporter [Coprinopsis cinerea AmutBmut pab1-1]